MKDKTVYFIGKLFTDIPKAGDEIAYLGIDRIASDGTPYEAVKCSPTEESAEKFNGEKDCHSCKLGLSKIILGKTSHY